MRVGVVGHVEWVDFLEVPHVPRVGEILHARAAWSEPAGGGAVAAVQLARLQGEATFFTALADDPLGRQAREVLTEHGVCVLAAPRPGPQVRAAVFLDADGERTITVFGPACLPRGDDPLPWPDLAHFDALYFAKGDVAALQAARQARVLVATARELPKLRQAGIRLDALVHSTHDPGEAYRPGDLTVLPRLVVTTEGAAGGRWHDDAGREGRYQASVLPGTRADAYGCGDSFAAGLTWALGRGLDVDAALRVAADCGAAALCRRGAHGAAADRSQS